MRPINDLNRQLDAVMLTLGLVLEDQRPIEPDYSPRAALLRKLKGLTQARALIEIASCNGGILNPKEAKALMIHAGIMRETKHSARLVHKVITRSNAFTRTGRGQYRLKETNLTPKMADLESVARIGQLPLPKPV
jgi:hypothetical protein